SNWLERLPTGSISTWEDLTTHFLAKFFPPGRTAKLCGKLRDRIVQESWALLEDLALYDSESWNDPRDFTKPVKAISLPQDVLITFDRRLIELENQVQRLMEAHLAPKQLIQVNKITSSYEIFSGPHEYASLNTDEVGGKQFTMNQGPRSFNEAANAWKGRPNF
ncbi:hypothetical protein Tco_0229773, partial [Tanacetum coccineum]